MLHVIPFGGSHCSQAVESATAANTAFTVASITRHAVSTRLPLATSEIRLEIRQLAGPAFALLFAREGAFRLKRPRYVRFAIAGILKIDHHPTAVIDLVREASWAID